MDAAVFVIAIVRQGDRYLLVEETKDIGKWYFPAGRVELGEDLCSALKREALEEAGIPIQPQGLLKLEYQPVVGGVRIRYIFVAEAASDVAPKDFADEHSQRAAWFSFDQIKELPLRAHEVVDLIERLERGAAVASMQLLED